MGADCVASFRIRLVHLQRGFRHIYINNNAIFRRNRLCGTAAVLYSPFSPMIAAGLISEPIDRYRIIRKPNYGGYVIWLRRRNL